VTIPETHPRYGYRRMTTIVRREGYCVNHKRIQRLCRNEGLRVLKKAKKRSRVGTSVTGTRLRASRTTSGPSTSSSTRPRNFKTRKLLNITDEFTREALAIEVHRSIDDTVVVLESLVGAKGRAPEFIRMDNGPELTANARRDWCRFWIRQRLHRAGEPMGEPIHRVLQRQAA
jgi:putative transposase